MKTGQDLLHEAEKHLGDPYRLGADVPLVQGDDYHGETDCAEVTTEVVQEVTGKIYGALNPHSDNPDPWTGEWYAQLMAGTLIQVTVDRAMRTPGALLLRRNGSGGHIVFSDGKGGTVEAMGAQWGVVRGHAAGRGFQWGIYIPGVCYEEV
jgi:N-acetylmuramoyl-L-alanine amidase